jgi:hypothetical protein
MEQAGGVRGGIIEAIERINELLSGSKFAKYDLTALEAVCRIELNTKG